MKDRLEAEKYFRDLRTEAYKLAEEGVHEHISPAIRLTEITELALQQAAEWPIQRRASGMREAAYWDWSHEVARFRRRPRRVEVAIWYEQTLLCGLALGRTSKNRVVGTIHLLEKNPRLREIPPPADGVVEPILVAPIAVRFLEAYALLLGCKEIAIDHPFADLVPYYESLGFDRRVTKGKKVLRLHHALTRR